MPGVFEHAPADIVPKRRRNEPVSISFIIGLGSLPYRFTPHSELGAACDTNGLWDRELGEELLVCPFVCSLCMDGLSFLSRYVVLDGMDLDRATKDPHASQVGIPLLLEIVEAQALEEREGVVVDVIVVPLEPLGVVEDNVSG